MVTVILACFAKKGVEELISHIADKKCLSTKTAIIGSDMWQQLFHHHSLNLGENILCCSFFF